MKSATRIIILVVVVAAAIIMATFAVTSARTNARAAEAETASHDTGYTVKLIDGEISVIKNDDGSVVPTGISGYGLKTVDINSLENGIYADTYEKVVGLLQDFSS